MSGVHGSGNCASRVAAIGEVVAVVEALLAGSNEKERGGALAHRSTIWSARTIGSDGQLEVADCGARSDFEAGGESGAGAHRFHVTSAQLHFDDFAVVRADEWSLPATALFTLFRVEGRWRIATEVLVHAGGGRREERFSPRTAEAEVLAALDLYYRAVERGDADALRALFAPGWEMKNFEAGVLVAEDTETFLTRWVEGKPIAGYADDRQIAGVEIAWDRLALVRVDRPSKPVAALFTFVRTAEGWRMIDKAWSERAGA